MILREPGSLLTFVGPPGVGKTRLALQVASSLRDDFADGCFFIPLASIGDSELILPHLARTLRLEDRGQRSIMDQVISHLRDKVILLLIDNFEHVIKATHLLVRLRSECSRLSILVTSRIALRVRGERQIHVQPLELPDSDKLPDVHSLPEYSAIALFVDRAQALQPAFILNDQNAADVVAICHRLGGLPLAIELIATNLCTLTPHMLLNSLKNGGLLESGELLDLEPRQSTLRNTFDWSYHLLAPVEQKFLERLAVFSGGWSLEAAREVCAIGDVDDPAVDEVCSSQVPAHLRSLVEKSLVTQHEENGLSRFTLLEVLREYLSEKFTFQEIACVIQRQHARYYLQLAENAMAQIHSIHEPQSLMQLEREIGNFRSALEWCLSTPQTQELGLRISAALWWFWARGGHITEGKSWLMKYIEKYEAADCPSGEVLAPLAKIYTGMGRLTWCQGDYRTALAWAEKSIALHRQVGEKWHLAYALQSLADILSDLGDYSHAQEIALKSQEIARELGDPWLEGLSHALFGEVARNRGDYREAQAQYAKSLTLARQAGDERNMVFMLHNLGQVAQRQGDYTQAQELHSEALRLQSRVGSSRSVAFGLENLADIARACAKPIKAARLLGAADALRHSAGCPVENTELPFYSGIISQVRAALDQHSFTFAWAEGYALTLQQAITYALEG
jgi:predicted ATPase/Tfp pilus assembly protein PilF